MSYYYYCEYYEAILVVMVITVYHTYYRSQWEAHMTTMMSKMMLEIEKSWRWSNNVYKNQDYHDDIADHPYTRDAVVSFCNYGNSIICVILIMSTIDKFDAKINK